MNQRTRTTEKICYLLKKTPDANQSLYPRSQQRTQSGTLIAQESQSTGHAYTNTLLTTDWDVGANRDSPPHAENAVPTLPRSVSGAREFPRPATSGSSPPCFRGEETLDTCPTGILLIYRKTGARGNAMGVFIAKSCIQQKAEWRDSH